MSRAIAEAIAECLFRNGTGQKAARLVLHDANERDLGGWCKKAVADVIERHLKTEGGDAT